VGHRPGILSPPHIRTQRPYCTASCVERMRKYADMKVLLEDGVITPMRPL
jgi:hypothetical protein